MLLFVLYNITVHFLKTCWSPEIKEESGWFIFIAVFTGQKTTGSSSIQYIDIQMRVSLDDGLECSSREQSVCLPHGGTTAEVNI